MNVEHTFQCFAVGFFEDDILMNHFGLIYYFFLDFLSTLKSVVPVGFCTKT